MIKLLLLSLVLLVSLHANKVIYFNYDEVPQRVVQGEIFPITLKTLSTLKNFKDIQYDFSNYKGLEVLTPSPLRRKHGKYFYDTFYLQSTKKWAKLPDINASIIPPQEYESTFIRGENLNIITLNPRNNFSNVIAEKFEIIKYKTTNFDTQHNIIVFVATAQRADLSTLSFRNVFKQGTESLTQSYDKARITYFLVVDKKIEEFSFSYFNLQSNKFDTLSIPVVVVEDSVTTQSDLKPKDQSKERLKMSIAGVVSFLTLIVILWTRKYLYLLLLIFPLIYIISLAIPEKELCIKKGTQIRLLPVDNGTIFETTTSKRILLKEGNTQEFVKIQLDNERIGWVRNEDICSN